MMLEPIKVFIGYDPIETVAYNVLAHSIQARASKPVSITPLSLNQLKGWYDRERDPRQSTDFAFTRFLVPWLCGFKGRAIFMDCDMLCLADIADLINLVECNNELRYKAVCVVKHNHVPDEDKKFLGRVQTTYPRKNWSSLMVFNNAQPACKALNPVTIEKTEGLFLHQFGWIADSDLQIGTIPHEWNHLVGVDRCRGDILDAKILHYTNGGPWFKDYPANGQADALWRAELAAMLYAKESNIAGVLKGLE